MLLDPPKAQGQEAAALAGMWKILRDSTGLVGVIGEPEDTAGVVGVARSGMLPAALLACHLHRPRYSVGADGLRDCGRGTRLRAVVPLGPVVLVDDTVYNGLQMRQREQLVRQHFGKQPIIRCAVYSAPQGAGAVDLIAALLWTIQDAVECRFAFLKEFTTQTKTSIVVPFFSLLEIAYNFRTETENVFHLFLVRRRSST